MRNMKLNNAAISRKVIEKKIIINQFQKIAKMILCKLTIYCIISTAHMLKITKAAWESIYRYYIKTDVSKLLFKEGTEC